MGGNLGRNGNKAVNAFTDAANKSIRENKALVFGVNALTCFALGFFWKSLFDNAIGTYVV